MLFSYIASCTLKAWRMHWGAYRAMPSTQMIRITLHLLLHFCLMQLKHPIWRLFLFFSKPCWSKLWFLFFCNQLLNVLSLFGCFISLLGKPFHFFLLKLLERYTLASIYLLKGFFNLKCLNICNTLLLCVLTHFESEPFSYSILLQFECFDPGLFLV